jgi:macrolide transport system ATP-binding/permease protein
MTPLLSLHDIRRYYVTGGGVEVQALRGVTLDIHAGEFVAIVGQSGSGKSTLMNIIGCLDQATGGEYHVAGRNIQHFDADGLAWLRREAFGFVFQSYNLLGNCSAEENVEMPAIYAGLPAEQRRQRAMELLQKLGLGERLDHRPTQLSGGQQQRVSIARALMNGGQIILADEPTGALDTQSGQEVMALLESLAQQGHTVIIITHDMEVAEHAQRIIEIKDGQIVRDAANPLWDTRQAEAPDQAAAEPLFQSNQPLDPAALLTSSTEQSGGGWNATREALHMAFRSLHGNVFRTILTLLGIVIGVSSVVAMLAIGEGAREQIIDRISSMGTNMLTIRPSFDRGAGMRGGESSALSIDLAATIADQVPNVAAVLPEIQGSATVRFGNQDYQTSITATTDNLPDTRSWSLAQGVFFTNRDSDEYTPVAVLGQTVYDSLFPDGSDPIGQYLLITNIPFQIIGVMTSKGSSGFGGRDQDDVVFVPLKTGGLRLFGQTFLRSATVAVEDPSLINETEAQLLAYLEQHSGGGSFRISNSAELLQTVSESQETFTLLLGSVAAISLLVGGIGVMNIMLVSVTERTREIGIRMATGARQSDILQQFLAEAIVVSCVGGVIGIIVGLGVGQLLMLFGTPITFTVAPMVTAFACAATTGLVFGYAPARKAARLNPVAALANE